MRIVLLGLVLITLIGASLPSWGRGACSGLFSLRTEGEVEFRQAAHSSVRILTDDQIETIFRGAQGNREYMTLATAALPTCGMS